MQELLGNADVFNALLGVSVLVLSGIVKIIASKFLAVKETDRILEKSAKILGNAVIAGTNRTYEVFVRACKEKSSDGKLTSIEKSEAMKMALQFAKDYAKDQGINLATEYGDELLKGLIEDYITNRKSNASSYRAIKDTTNETTTSLASSDVEKK